MVIAIKIRSAPYSMQLLVSPCTVEEARSSLAADIIDIKNPLEGSLGANFPWVIRAVRQMTRKPLSAAIGDVPFRPGNTALAALGAASAGADYIKVGLMFNGREDAMTLIKSMVKAVKETFPEKFIVIAGYADHARLDTISPLLLPQMVADSGGDVAMIDTGIKDGKGLFSFMGERALREFVAKSRTLGIKTALAGSLQFSDLETLRRINPDIIGVRGMVCGGDRNTTIREDLVEKALRSIR